MLPKKLIFPEKSKNNAGPPFPERMLNFRKIFWADPENKRYWCFGQYL